MALLWFLAPCWGSEWDPVMKSAIVYRLDDYRPHPPALMPWDWWLLGLMVWAAPFQVSGRA